jgi:hypothetical protein
MAMPTTSPNGRRVALLRNSASATVLIEIQTLGFRFALDAHISRKWKLDKQPDLRREINYTSSSCQGKTVPAAAERECPDCEKQKSPLIQGVPAENSVRAKKPPANYLGHDRNTRFKTEKLLW